jgi:hypothetical protein
MPCLALLGASLQMWTGLNMAHLDLRSDGSAQRDIDTLLCHYLIPQVRKARFVDSFDATIHCVGQRPRKSTFAISCESSTFGDLLFGLKSRSRASCRDVHVATWPGEGARWVSMESEGSGLFPMLYTGIRCTSCRDGYEWQRLTIQMIRFGNELTRRRPDEVCCRNSNSDLPQI